jgi:hypothetical protein
MQSRKETEMSVVGKLAAGWRVAVAATIGLGAAIVILAQASAGGGTLTVGNVTLLEGEDAQFQLQVTDTGSPGLGAWIVDIDYDSSLVTPTLCTPGQSGLCNASYSASTVRVVGARSEGLRGTQTLATLRFRCDDEGATALAITAVEFADATSGAPQPIDVNVQHGSINCMPAGATSNVRGDANCDGQVNSIDALIVLQFVARLRSSVPCPDLADYDHNGQLTSVDASLILQDDAGLI